MREPFEKTPMANTPLTKIGPLRALQLCLFGVFFPQKLVEAELGDKKIRDRFPKPSSAPDDRDFKLRRGLFESLVWVLSSIAAGFVAGRLLRAVSGETSATLVSVLQIIGATILLWATLFVRGWDIQSYGGVTLTERVNRWIYRLLYCLGTAAIVASLGLW